MAKDEEQKVPTTRPPPGDDDVYNASTVVGAASEDILAIIRESEPGRVGSASRSDDGANKVAVPKAAPVPRAESMGEAHHGTAKVHATPARGAHPAVSIGILFAAAGAVLALLAR